MSFDVRRLLAVAAVCLLSVGGCDRFIGYTVWVVNTSGYDRTIVLGQPGGLSGGMVPTYRVPSDGVIRRTEFVVTNGTAREIYVFDESCAPIGSVPVPESAGYILALEPSAKPRIEQVADDAQPTAPAVTPLVATDCSPAALP